VTVPPFVEAVVTARVPVVWVLASTIAPLAPVPSPVTVKLPAFPTFTVPVAAAALTVIAVVLLTVPVAPVATETVPDAVLVMVPVIAAVDTKFDDPLRVRAELKLAGVTVIVLSTRPPYQYRQ